MGFVQKLAKRKPGTKVNDKNNCPTCRMPYRREIKIPKLTWKYVFNLKNWK
tara:strand:- start:1243 stop:1395 length:153 start_codon:yes stop_codon:yes gene_type:complete